MATVCSRTTRVSPCSFIHARQYRLTQRAPDWWESPRFQAVFVARSWFRQSGVVSSHPPAGNAHR